MNQEYLTKKQKKMQAREERRKTDLRKNRGRRTKKYIVGIFVIALIGYGGFLLAQTLAPKGSDDSKSFSIQGRNHIRDGSSHPPYNSNPPSSGWHYAGVIRTGFYDLLIADERIIHNLEHGDIWITYHPRISDEIKKELEKLASSIIIITPREVNDTDISLVAWGRVDSFNIENGRLNEQRINDFVKRYRNKGPERVSPAKGGF